MKTKILSLVLAAAMVLALVPAAYAASDDGFAGVEEILLQETFETEVSYEEESNEVELGRGNDVFNGWKLTNTSGTSYTDSSTFKIVKESDNQVLAASKSSWTNSDGLVSMQKATNTVTTDSGLYRLSFKLKRDASNPGSLVLSFGGVQWVMRFDNGRLYAGAYSNSAGDSFYTFSADKWYNVEIIADFKNKKYSYYVDNNVIISTDNGLETTAVRSINQTVTPTTVTSLSIYAIRNGLSGVAGAQVYVDDIVLTAVDEKRVCEIAAEKTALASSVTGNISLPTAGYGGTTISWSSSNEELVSSTGDVTRPESGDVVPVTLTATISLGAASAEYPFTVKVLPLSVAFYEDFEGVDAPRSVTGYNGWSETLRRGYNDGTLCWKWEITKDTAANNAARVEKTQEITGLSKVNANQVEHNFDEISGKTASVSFKFRSDSASNWLELVLKGNTTKYFVFRMNDRAITENGSHLNGGSAKYFANNDLSVWHTARLDLDLQNGTYDLIVDGALIGENLGYNASSGTVSKLTSLSGVGLSLAYDHWGDVGKGVDFDDISVTTGKAEYPYGIVEFSFKNASGETTLYPKVGGSVCAVTVKKYDTAANALLLAAVYSGGKLVGTDTVDVSNAPINEETTYPVSIATASDDVAIKAFVLDKTTLLPLALGKTYEKRVPLTVFVAGDSMAENVAQSTSSKEVDGTTVTYAREGWGMRIGELFTDGSVTVANRAVGGQSAKNFIDGGRLQAVLTSGNRGDFVLVSFGHNDDGQNISLEDYKANLKTFSQLIKKNGMTPVFITSIPRISMTAEDSADWTTGGYDSDDLYTYATAMKEAATACGDVCLDLYSAFCNELQGKTYQEARTYYVSKEIDGTHLSPDGAKKAAQLIAELLGQSNSALKELLK